MKMIFFHETARRLFSIFNAYYANERKNTRTAIHAQEPSLRKLLRLAMLKRAWLVYVVNFSIWSMLACAAFRFVYALGLGTAVEDAVKVGVSLLQPLLLLWLMQNYPECEVPLDARYLCVTSVVSDHFDNVRATTRALREAIDRYNRIAAGFWTFYGALAGGVISLFFSSSPIILPFVRCAITVEQFILSVGAIAYFSLLAYGILIAAPRHWMRRVLDILECE